MACQCLYQSKICIPAVHLSQSFDPFPTYSYALDQCYFVSFDEFESVDVLTPCPLRHANHTATADEHSHEKAGYHDRVQDDAELFPGAVVGEDDGEEHRADGFQAGVGHRAHELAGGAGVEGGAVL